MSKLLPTLSDSLQDGPVQRPSSGRSAAVALDLVRLARQSLGDKLLETELLGHFDRQAGLALAKLRDLDARGAPGSGALAAMLAASARTVGAHGTAAACDGYAALLADGASPQARGRALDILDEEIGIVRAKIADLFSR